MENLFNKEEINVVSLFDGISCGQVALEKAEIKVANYFASEIKKTAIKVTRDNYPKTKQLGNVLNVNWFGLPEIDLLIGGSPCKGISLLNKNQDGLKHAESRLFYEYVRIKDELNPKYFLLENTHGNKSATDTISEILGVKPISINSKLVSAQNRPRYYWTNIPGVEPPFDKNILSSDYDLHKIKGHRVPENRVKWIKSESGISSVSKGYTKVNPRPKFGCLTANGHKKWNENYILIDGEYYFLSQEMLEKLQTLPLNYTSSLSYPEASDVIGDGWTVDVVAHIFSYLKIKNLPQIIS